MAGRSNNRGKVPSATDRRLAQVRALKALHFADELTVEEQIEAKDAKISLLEDQVTELERRLAAAERRPVRPQPETAGLKSTQSEAGLRRVPPAVPDASQDSDADDDDRRFNFYRD